MITIKSTAMTKLSPPKLFFSRNPLFTPDKNNVTEMKLLFEKAVAESISINIRPGNEIALRLHSLYRQATKGDINIENYGNLSDAIAKEEYDAWAALKGKSIKDAQSEFIVLVNELKN